MRIGLIEFLLILAIASLTVGPRVALFVDRWMRRANRANAMAARRRAEYAAQMAAERDAMLKRFRTASTVFGVGILLVLVYALGFRPIDTPPQIYKAPDLRQETGAMQTAVSTDRKTQLELGEYQGVDCIRAKDGLLYAAAWNGAALKKRTSDLVRKKLYMNTVEFFRTLDIPVRTLECCSGDLADLKCKSVDVEAWSPRQKKYFEVGSCSNLTDAQARRLKIRVKGENGEKYYAHTLNNTCVAPPRMLIAFLENNLQEDGSILIPEALQPYMGGKKKIG